ncbi:MAG TPA: PilZ domain-containing protein [Desulfobulbus sp.]|nr:PilZ domain-containing protein [Desulfobulbus sp.]
MKSKDKRSYARVLFNRKARLILHDKVYEDQPIKNLSLIGMFIAGSFDAALNDICTVELHETGRHTCLTLSFIAKIVRVEKDGLGLEFENMQPDSYMFLQTMILYATQDPLSVAEEFLEDFPPNQGVSH